MFVAVNKKNVIMAVSEKYFAISGHTTKVCEANLPKSDWHTLIGTKANEGAEKVIKDLKVAFICNWNDCCGISTYTKFLVDAMRPKVKEIRIFSEEGLTEPTEPDDSSVTRCWKRGTSMKMAMEQVLGWEPDLVIVQHEFGIFPKATFFLQMLQMLEDIPHLVTTHSVYEHLDKSVCTSAIKNIVVHSEEAKQCLRRLGNNSRIFVIPHGCVELQQEDKTELWNIFQTPYALVQFGFGFFYKGVDRVLDAIHLLKLKEAKFHEMFYVYLCSDNKHTNMVHAQYYEHLMQKINELDLHDNAAIIRKYQTSQTINHYLRTAKLALFPYMQDPKNIVYGASGAIRVAMANGIPVIASSSHMFDDLEGVVPRPTSPEALAKEIDEVFSNEKYRRVLLDKQDKYIKNNTWSISADRYLKLFYEVLN